MRHYPTMDELAALLDAALDDEHRRTEQLLIETSQRVGRYRSAGRHLARTIADAIAAGSIQPHAVDSFHQALTVWRHTDT